MKIIGCDFHPSYQQIAMVDTETGELWEGRLEHEQGEARRFYQALQGQTVRVGIEAVGNSQWFEQMLAEMGHELWIGDAARIRRLVVREQKTDRRDAKHILDLLVDGRFPRLSVPSQQIRDVRQLLRHRQKVVAMLDRLQEQVGELDGAVRAEAEQRPEVRLLMTHPGVGPVVGLAYVLTIGPTTRFPRGKQVA